jgi:putative serine protease PepD
MSRISALIPTAIAGAAAGGVVALAIAGSGGGSSKTVTSVVTQSAGGVSIPTSLTKTQGMTINQIYRADSPGVVDITVVSEQNTGVNLLGQSTQQQSEGEGAGVVYDKNGDILTDEHVVKGAVSVKVHFRDGLTASARVLGVDPSTDVGVIRVNVPASELHPIAFANSAGAQVGDPVVAIGSPFSEPWTTTAGIVSAVDRDITAPNNYTITGAIQTDAAINPGNSGGPLIDADGRVLGLNDQIQTNSGSSAGIGFATPGNTDVRVANAIIGGHPIQHAYVGVCLVSGQAGGAQIAAGAGQSCQSPVASGSPAAKAGLKPGDVIKAINGAAVTSTNDFINSIGAYSPGQTITLTVKRGSQTLHIRVTLEPRPASAPTG